ncbi:gephyrin-like molybdotransferase Glp [Brachybacterium sp. GCM10030252]|uniref:molybdopterin molybdotransferase MoeA n=1 Tax=Brachybacterium sp. GCM10030252 TaxID=3273380 RepID=UPI00361AC61C
MSADRIDPWRWRASLIEAAAGRLWPVRTGEPIPLAESSGRRLAEPVRAPEDLPAVAESAMDGFAVHASDLADGDAVQLPVIADLPATATRPGAAEPHVPTGTAARIMTGAPIPAGADSVVEIERTDAEPAGQAPTTVRIAPPEEMRPGRHVRGPGEEVARDCVLAEAGDVVGPGLVGLAATLGLATLTVQPRLRVGVLVTGDEVVDGRHGVPEPGGIRDSNGLMLAAAVAELGHTARTLRSGDAPAQFQRALEQAAEDSDLVITTGGIGYGAYDVVKATLGPDGRGTSHFAHLALRPGGPQGFGTGPGGVPVIHLPGTPVGALVGFHLFARPVLAGEAGIARARLAAAAEGARPRTSGKGSNRVARAEPTARTLHALPGRLSQKDGEAWVELLPGRRLMPFARADALVLLELAAGAELPEGDHVRVMRLAAGSPAAFV